MELFVIGVPEEDRENKSKLENTIQNIIQEIFLKSAKQANIEIQEYKQHHRNTPQEKQPMEHYGEIHQS